MAGICVFAVAALGASELPRERLNFNREWKFLLGDHSGAEAIAFDDARWESIGLPHSFSIPYFGAGNAFYLGYGWYRKRFEAPENLAGKRLFLDFEGAFQDAEIFLNGKKVGVHQGGYTGFEIDITDAVKPGENVLAVRLNNLWNARLAPRAELRSEVVDPAGKVVASFSAKQTIPAGKTVTFDQTSAPLASPQFWSPETPVLYRVVSTVLDEAVVADRYETPFGIRSIQWTAEQGFFPNGQHRYLKGANVHQDHAWGATR